MQIKFDSNQIHQLEPIQSVLDLFEGQIHLDETDIDEIILSDKSNTSIELTSDLAIFTNKLTVNLNSIYSKLNEIQNSKGLEVSEKYKTEENGLNFTIEMETGTGKTYVYLRTIFELNQKYGFKKFIIVVPNVAIREGVLKNLEITKKHFKSLYDIPSPDFFVYDSDKLNKVYDFISSEKIQIMIINIQAFNSDNTIFNTEHYKLNGYSSQEVIGESSPIVIIDEPQIVDNTEKGKQAIASLNPLFTLRYSATHRDMYNQLHRLSPIDAFDQKLVKSIQVDSIGSANEYNNAYIKLLEIDNRNGIKAKVKINKQLVNEVKKTEMWIKLGDNLFEKSSQRSEYENGFEVQEINAGEGFIEFDNQKISIGEEVGSIKADIVRLQIKSLVKTHFEKQSQVKGNVKVLSLIFLDKVSNYRQYDENGEASKGPYAEIFEEEYNEYLLKNNPINKFTVDQVHDGYFSADKSGKAKGKFKDTSGSIQADNDTYNKIMKDKEKLLSIDEPLQFIFSHSALGVGWDNPNVFQICTLNETNSIFKKRQEIGRGLRLPVDINGERVRDENINILTVITNESYTDFANKLQKEFEDDCGIVFGVIKIDSFVSLAIDNGESIESSKLISKSITKSLVEGGIINKEGKILKKEINYDVLNAILPENQKPNTETIKNRIIELSSIKNIVKPKIERKVIKLKYSYEELEKLEEFSNLWSRISQKTTYKITLNSTEFTDKCIARLNDELTSITKIELVVTRVQIDTKIEGVETTELNQRKYKTSTKPKIPNLIERIKNNTGLRKTTIVNIIKGHKYSKIIFNNPDEYIEKVTNIIKEILKTNLINGITYEKIDNEFWELKNLEQEIQINSIDFIDANFSIYDSIIVDSENEKNFVNWCEKFSKNDSHIKLYFKLPNWFKISTPIGSYNPDWALVWEDEPDMLYLIRETKFSSNPSNLRQGELDKIQCGKKHFKAISTDGIEIFNIAVPKGNDDFDIKL